MTRARDIANLVDANGDIVAGALDNVPAADLVNDTTPQLGGNLDLNSNNITGDGSINIGVSGNSIFTSTGTFAGLQVKSTQFTDIELQDTTNSFSYIMSNRGNEGFEILSRDFSGGSNVYETPFKITEGRVTLPQQPYFYATSTGSGDGNTTSPFKFQNVIHNVGNHFKTSGTGAHERFVAPIAGVYLFTSNPGYKQTGANLQVRIAVNGSNFTDMFRLVGGNTSHSGGSSAALIKLNANDYVDMNPDGTTYHLNPSFSYFSGILLG